LSNFEVSDDEPRVGEWPDRTNPSARSQRGANGNNLFAAAALYQADDGFEN